jgi:hypothetical protein
VYKDKGCDKQRLNVHSRDNIQAQKNTNTNTNTNVAKLIKLRFYCARLSGNNMYSNYLLCHISIQKIVGYASNVPFATNNVFFCCWKIEIKR